jgi:hypothetical protein
VLFDDRLRADPRPATGEAVFEFLDRVEGSYWAAVREVLNAWFVRYPAEHRADLRDRLFDEDKTQPAFWELLLHELYTAAGFSVAVHPTLEGSDRRPDFRISDHEGAFLLEARVVTATSDDRRRRDRRLRTLIDAINETRPRNFYVKLDIVAEGRSQPAVAPVVTELEQWLAQLDPVAIDDSLDAQSSLRGLPSREIATGEWLLRFTPVPVDPGKRGQLTGPLIGIGPVQTSYSDPTAAIRKALGKKGRRYGTPRLPLVVALALEELGIETGDVAAALFGKVALILSGGGEPVVVGQRRLDDGYWSARRGAGERVAAVLTLATPRPWNVGTVQPHLWLNPWARMPYAVRRIWQWTTVDAQTGEFREGPAEATTAGLLRLPSDWPPGEAFDRKDGGCRSS